MSRRTVIGLNKTGDTVHATLERAPFTYTYDSVEVDLTAVDGHDLVERGEQLAALLRSGDPVRTGLETLLRAPDADDATPLYFQIRSNAADAIAWEQIHDPDRGFCALDRRSPVGRIADRVNSVRGRTFTPPLRIVAVLSAAGRDSGPQLEALRAGVAAYGLPVELRVISGDTDLEAELTGPGECFEPIAATGPELGRQLAAARPHLLHLLCHGRKHSGAVFLDFASIANIDGSDPEGGIKVSMADLVAALRPCDPWLVVLAACATAETGTPGDRPFVHDLVANGLTAAIGMRRLVDLHDTDRFCRELYPALARNVRAAVEPPGRGEQVIDWAACLTTARQVLSSPDPATVDAWLDPVLYVQSEDLRVIAEGAAGADEISRLQGRLDTYRAFRKQQSALGVVPEVLARVDARIAEAEAALAALASPAGPVEAERDAG